METMAAPSSKILSGGSATLEVLGRRYDILGEAGRGAMGQVYKARDRETGEVVALKLLKPEIASDPGMVERFKSELLFARKITHKNVCRVYEFNRIDGIAYTSMEFVEGESLRSVLKRFGSLAPRKAFDIALQMCAGLKEAHTQGIVHRDLKPENVMIDGQSNVKVMDFGIARSMEALASLSGSIIGTPAYMAPEQAAGKAVDYRADIYAVGLMLYEMFTGTQPFQADNVVTLALKHLQETPLPPRTVDPAISPFIESTILKCLEKSPADRFQSIAELEAALRTELPASGTQIYTAGPFIPPNTTNLPAAAAPQSPTPPSLPAAAKSKRAGLVALVLAVALAAVGGGMFWYSHTRREAAQSAIDASTVHPVPASVPSAAVVQPAKPPVPTASEAATAEIPAEPKTNEVTKSPHVDANAASSVPHRQLSSALAATASNPSRPTTAGAGPGNEAETSSQSSPPAQETVAAPGAKGGGGYVFVSRFPREVGAQNASRKIEDMGLPVSIVPKHNAITDEDFFVVLSGPYKAARMDEVIAQLKAKGFAQARPNKPPAGGSNAAPLHGSKPAH